MKPYQRVFTQLCAMTLFGWAAAAPAEFIIETASLGPTGQGSGYRVASDQILGARFSTTQSYAVTAVGGHLVNSFGTFYGAIIKLAGPEALPQGTPFNDGEVVASAISNFDGLSQDVSIPLSVLLPPGDYALVFGSGMFGATDSQTAMPGNNTDLPGADRFFWDGITGAGWTDGGVLSSRFFVTASAVPEPGSEAFLLLAGGLLLLRRRAAGKARS